MTLWQKVKQIFSPDKGLEHPEIQEIEDKIKVEQHQADMAEFTYQIPHVNRVQILKSKSDAERIRQGLSPKYEKYSESEQKELLKKYPPEPLSYLGQLKKFADEIRISPEDISKYKQWLKRYKTSNISEKSILEFFIYQRTKKNPEFENNPLIQRIKDRRSLRKKYPIKRSTSKGIPLRYFFQRHIKD